MGVRSASSRFTRRLVKRLGYGVLLWWFPAWAILGAVMWREIIERLYKWTRND
jgi:hypothetical protein